MDSKDKATYHTAIKALRERLDPGNQSIAALDFHTSQKPSETVSDFIRRLEKVFQKAFDRENLSAETRDMLLYGQLQEGLSYTLMESPSVSGSQNYRELCIAAKKEERRLAELERKQHYLKDADQQTESFVKGLKLKSQGSNKFKGPWNKSRTSGYLKNLRCYLCDSPNHLARDCKISKSTSESQGRKAMQ